MARTELRRALSTFLTGVTIVTTVDSQGSYRGITANSFTSVSLDPPMVLVCVDRAAASYDAFAACAGFAVHVLSSDQRELAALFASKSAEKFTGVSCREGITGAPILEHSAAWFDCTTEQQIVVGDHVVVIGKVAEFGVEGHRPLGYHQGQYLTLAPEQGILQHDQGGAVEVGWIAVNDDNEMVLQRASGGAGWTVPRLRALRARLDDDSLQEQARRCLGMPADIQFLYSIFDRPAGEPMLMVYRAHLQSGEPRPVDSALQLFHLTEIPWQEITDNAVAAMLRRYVQERAGERFGLYAGSIDRGRTATIAEISPGRGSSSPDAEAPAVGQSSHPTGREPTPVD